MTYATSAAVVDLCPRLFNVTGGGPAASSVNAWLEEGDVIINARLQSQGYTMPVATSASAYAMLRNLSALYGSAMAEQSRSVQTSGADPNQRYVSLEDRFNKRLDSFLQMDLSGMGITHTCNAYAGGISIADKDTVESDSDRPMTAFRRGMHAYPGAGTTAADAPQDEEERAD